MLVKVLDRLAIAVAACVLMSCSQDTSSAATQSLLASEDVAFLCAHEDKDGALVGDALEACPLDPDNRSLYSLVTQPETGEVAVLDLSGCSDGGYCRPQVLDLERTQPGVTFLPVGGEPGSIVATPGGLASFVAVREAGREGIFGLPTKWIGPRPDNQAMRDVRTWPACRLPAAPGAMQLVVDRDRSEQCAGGQDTSPPSRDLDLAREVDAPGRRALLVALPTRGEVWSIDAQELLNRAPGSFDDCPVDSVVTLDTARPDVVEQRTPSDLSGDGFCAQVPTLHPAVPAEFASVPSDFALADDRLYVADTGAPVVHVVDVSDTCALSEGDPLLPVAFTQPGLVVPTRKVAVSPLSSKGERFVYAIDGSDSALAGSVMIFDVSSGSSDRTPIVRPRSGLIGAEPPDRIRFSEEAADVEFVMRDYPATDNNGVALENIRCSADPDDQSIATAYRPGTSLTGAEPTSLRGLFGFIALQSGYVAIVDVDDLDADCRRTASVNPSSTPNERGCADDPWSDDLTLTSTTYSVSDETSCHIVEPHRVRSYTFYSHHDNGTAPALRGFPQLRSARGVSLLLDQTDQGLLNPKLLGVPRPGENESRVFVNATELRTLASGPDQLVLDPGEATRATVLLPEAEPRAYGSGGGNFGLVYEGAMATGLRAAIRTLRGDEQTRGAALGARKRYASFAVPENGQFCFAGVEDEVAVAERGLELLDWQGNPPQGLDALTNAERGRIDTFVQRHTDYVSVTDVLPAAEDRYWSERGAECGASYPWSGGGAAPDGRTACTLIFGGTELDGRDAHRDFRIVRAFNDELFVEPRAAQSDRDGVLDALACCFPYSTQFEIRASNEWVYFEDGGVPNAIRPNPDSLACERRTCDPLLSNRQGRVLEVGCADASCPGIGRQDASRDAEPCVLPGSHTGPLLPGELPDGCYLSALTARSALYRGTEPSYRGMVFTWSTSGGFTPMLLNLYQQRGTVSPRRLNYIPQINNLVVADGGSVGITFLSLRRYDGGPGFSFGTIL
jgi:hypothetical protein